jgi:hypothetical protein
MFKRFGDRTFEGVGYGGIAQLALRGRNLSTARDLANLAWELAIHPHSEKDLICAARLQGEIALGLGDSTLAHERLTHALTHSRLINFVEEELPTLVALAEWHLRNDEFADARELLDQVWAPAARGPYPLWHADARNVLAQLERDLGHRDAAVEAATAAYRLAWCDGPPYAYHYGLTNARRHLQELGVPEPPLSPFDESKFERMPEVELNPKDKFWVDPTTLS